MMKKIIIAIDGFAACGKSTLARQLAHKLHYLFLDTGAMYRAVTLHLLDNQIDWRDAAQLNKALGDIKIQFGYSASANTYSTYLNGKNVEKEIRTVRVSDVVSEVAAVSAVRKFLVAQQQQIGKEGGIVLDGRDIGTVVYPHAELKIFVVADLQVRIQRRLLELQANGIQIREEEIKNNLLRRDHEETTRIDSPLRMADDAVLLDNSTMTPDEQLEWALLLARERIRGK
jgi:cytidylate kinase